MKDIFKLVVLSTLTVCVIATVLFESVPLAFVRMFGTDGGELYTAFAIGCLRIYLSLVIFTCLHKACAIAREHGSAGKRIGQLVVERTASRRRWTS